MTSPVQFLREMETLNLYLTQTPCQLSLCKIFLQLLLSYIYCHNPTQQQLNLTRLRLDIIIKPNPPHPTLHKLSKLTILETSISKHYEYLEYKLGNTQTMLGPLKLCFYSRLENYTDPSLTVNAFYIELCTIQHLIAPTIFCLKTNQPAAQPLKRVNEAPVGKDSPELKKTIQCIV